MPGFDGTGPRGMGPMTGGGRGFCAVPLGQAWPTYTGVGFYSPYTAPVPRYGASMFMPRATREGELNYLSGLAQSMRDDLKEIEARIAELSTEKE